MFLYSLAKRRLFCPSLDLDLPRSLVLGTTGALHPPEQICSVQLKGAVSITASPCPEGEIKPLWGAEGADSRPKPSRCSTDGSLEEYLYIPLCGQGLFTGRFPEDSWHISAPSYFSPDITTTHPEEGGSQQFSGELVNPSCLPHKGLSRGESSALSQQFHSLPPLLLLL